MAAAFVHDITHDYAVYSQHTSVKSKLSNGFEDQEKNTIGDENESNDESAKLAADSKASSYRLSLLSSNIQAEQETLLRSFLTKRLERQQPLPGNGNIVSIPSGKVYNQTAMIYYYFMKEENFNSQNEVEVKKDDQESQKRTFLICFIADVETGLDLFQNELDNYCNLLSPYIHKYMESVDVSEYLKRLEAWYDINICYIQRCLSYLDHHLSSLLFSIFLGRNIKMDGLSEEAEKDLKKFIACCSLSELLQENKNSKETELPRSTSMNELELVIRKENEDYILTCTKTNQFCDDCIKSMKQVGLSSPLKMRQVIENYKIKFIRHMNTFKRLTKQAETDYYALYRSYVFLLSCDNGEVLLKNAKAQCEAEDNEHCKDVLGVIENFIAGKMGFDGIQKEEKSKMKAQHLLRLLNC